VATGSGSVLVCLPGPPGRSRFRRAVRVALTALLVAGSCPAEGSSSGAPPAAAIEPASADAETLFRDARALHEQKKWTEARAAYQRAWESEHSVRVAANLALVELALGLPRDAAEHLGYALAHLPAEDPKTPDARTQLEDKLREARARLGTVDIDTRDAGATVSVDGENVGVTPLPGPLYLKLGRHVIRIERAGMRAATREITVEAGGSYPLAVSLVPDVKAGAAALPRLELPRARASTQPGPDPRLFVLLGGGALALGAATAGTVFLVERTDALHRVRELGAEVSAQSDPLLVQGASECAAAVATRPTGCADLRRAAQSESRLGEEATIAFVAAGGFVVATVATYFLWPSRAELHDAPGKLRFGASFVPGAQGVHVSGTF